MKNKNQRAPLVPLNIQLDNFFRRQPFSPEKINESLANAQPFETHTYTQARNRPPSAVQKKKLTDP
jgi:Tfp pilus assembly protein PilP